MLSRQNANLPKGQLADDHTTADILANDQLLKAEDYKPLIVTYQNGAAVRLSDIANVQDGVENIRAAGFLNGKPSIPMIILRQPGANIIQTVDRIKAALPSLKASIPAAINVDIVLDRTTTIRASVREIAVVLSTAILVSLVVSLTTTPMMCARLLRHQKPEEHGKFYRASEKLFAWLLSSYEQSLRVVLRHPAITLTVLLITVAVNIFLFMVVPKGFFPQQDNGTVFGGIQGAQDASFPAMQAATARIDNLAKEDPAVANAIGFTGGQGAANSGFLYLALKPLDQRKLDAGQVISRLRPKFAAVRGASVFVQAGQDLRIGGRQSQAQYQYTIQSDNLQDLVKWGPILLQQMRKLPGLTDVNSDQQNNGLQASLEYDRATAARLGVSSAVIDNTVYDAFGQRQVSTMYTTLNQYHVVMEVAPQFWQGPEGLNAIYLRSTNGGPVIPLSAIAHYEPTTAPIAVNHQGQFPAVTLSFNLAPGMALSDAVKIIHEMEQDIGMPGRIHGSFSGTLQAFQASLASEPFLILAALAAVYIVLGILYESYIHPITILSTLPSAGVGAVLALMLF